MKGIIGIYIIKLAIKVLNKLGFHQQTLFYVQCNFLLSVYYKCVQTHLATNS